jgi:hypothetical protein
MAKKGGVNWIINILLTLFLDPLWQGIRRCMKGHVLLGIIWIITCGLLGIGWLIDLICVLIYKDIKILA